MRPMNTDMNRQGPRDEAQLVSDWLAGQTLGSVVTSGALSLIPLYGKLAASAIGYRTLTEAIAQGEARITEQSQATVNGLRVLNRGALPVLILDGEEIVGGMQNRVVNTTILIPPKTAFDLPVSCIEHGRWHATASVFHAGEAVHPTLRREKSQQVTVSLQTAEAPLADQHSIWSEVQARHRATRTASATAALNDVYVQRGKDLERVVDGLSYPSDSPIGVVALIDGHAECVDLFDRPETLRVYWNRLVRSYALEVLDRTPCEPSIESAARLLEGPRGAVLTPFESVGMGTDVRITGNGVVGAALVLGAAVLHTALFRQRQRRVESGLQSPRARARRIAGSQQD